MNQALLLVNFGGPRTLNEVEPFLCELLTDCDLIRPKLPLFFHNLLFRRIAKKRAVKVRPDYEQLGGGSPIYETTETLATLLRERTGRTVITFHRYLPSTHKESLRKIEEVGELIVFPLFPQFSYTTTGSIARVFSKRLSQKALTSLRWIKSYPAHDAYINAQEKIIRGFLEKNHLLEKECLFLLSAHGIPLSYCREGDPYEFECRQSARALLARFPEASSKISFQSQFGPEEWLRPYTKDLCENVSEWLGGKKSVIFIPLSFTSDHLETLFEIEELYLPVIKAQGVAAFRCPALNLDPAWIDALPALLDEKNFSTNSMLIRNL